MAASNRIFEIPTGAASGYAHLQNGQPLTIPIDLSSGTSTVVVGANGSGKTRLGASIEGSLAQASHRIGAQRSIAMTQSVILRDYDSSINELHHGHTVAGNRQANRWQGKPATAFLSDFEALLRALFAQQNRALTDDHHKRKAGEQTQPPNTRIDDLVKIWQSIMPHRSFIFKDASISVKPPANPVGTGGDEPYSPTELSDGERVAFYLIGQCLLAPDDGVIIIDEPELHIHPSITDALWDALEQARTDCAFVYLTYDLEFAANRVTAKKYYLKAIHYNSFFDIEAIPDDTGLPEELVLALAGNRKPVLFIEGDKGSLDLLIYRSAYPAAKVEPIGACDSVIHAVATFKANPTMHRWGDVFGCVDADQRDTRQIADLQKRNIWCLPVAEVENVFLMPSIFFALAEALSIDRNAAESLFGSVKDHMLAKATEEISPTTARYAARQIDRRLKNVTVSRKDSAELIATFSTEVAAIDVSALISAFQNSFHDAINTKDMEKLLAMFDQKGLLVVAAKALGFASSKSLVQQVARFVSDGKHPGLKQALLDVLPRLPITVA